MEKINIYLINGATLSFEYEKSNTSSEIGISFFSAKDLEEGNHEIFIPYSSILYMIDEWSTIDVPCGHPVKC